MNEAKHLKIAQDCIYSLNSYETKLNNNVAIIGASGSGKTRHIMEPNIATAEESMIIVDPKDALYKKYASSLTARGYRVKKIDFIHPGQSEHYNPFDYVTDEDDIARVVSAICGKAYHHDPYWDNMTALFLRGLVAHLLDRYPHKVWNLRGLSALAAKGARGNSSKSPLESEVAEYEDLHGATIGTRLIKQVTVTPDKTYQCILSTVNEKLGALDRDGIFAMNRAKGKLDFAQLGHEKTALFVAVSDSDRSCDALCSLFLTQAIQELFKEADRIGGPLPMPVRFLLDDYASGCQIPDFDRIISVTRSRNISFMMCLQSQAQLETIYGRASSTIIANCDTIAFLSNSDLRDCEEYGRRANKPMREMLNMPIGSCWVFRRGMQPVFAELMPPVADEAFELDYSVEEKENGQKS